MLNNIKLFKCCATLFRLTNTYFTSSLLLKYVDGSKNILRMATPDIEPKYCSNKRRSDGSKVEWGNWKLRFKQRYASCTETFIDSHCHIDFLFDRSGFVGSYQRYMSRNEDTYVKNYAGCVAVFCDPRTFTPEGGMWKDHLSDPFIWGAMGCHPKSISDFTPQKLEDLKRCMKHPKLVALGEIGLDYSGNFYKQSEAQKRGFRDQLELAIELNKPLVIHCRDAEDDCFEIMKELVPKDYLIHRHCFTSDWAEATRWLEYFPNLFIGLTPLVTYRSARSVHEVAQRIPLQKLLLETDAPYFVPTKIPREAMEFSHPGMAITVAEEVARLQGRDIDEVLYHCRKNTRKMYSV